MNLNNFFLKKNNKKIKKFPANAIANLQET